MKRASKGPGGLAGGALWPGAGQPPISSGSKGSGEGGLSVLQEQKSADPRHRDVRGDHLLPCLGAYRNSQMGLAVAAVQSLAVLWSQGA